MPSRILSVGQCEGDDYRVERVLRAQLDPLDLAIESVPTAQEGFHLLREKPYDLVLVNRILDGDGVSGVDFITHARATTSVPFMLISDYDEAQAEAVAHGAKLGFGKSGMSVAAERVREALGIPATDAR